MNKVGLYMAIMLLYGVIGYLLYFPAAQIYFSGSQLIISDIRTAFVSQFQTALLFALSGAAIFYCSGGGRRRLLSLRGAVLCVSALAFNFAWLFLVLLAKRVIIDTPPPIPGIAISIEYFGLMAPQLIATGLTCLCLFFISKKGARW
ncbi:hypothetical protein FJU30_20485 [Affinibrenneria salicis]|uniref:Uncharacterized protein n=1 Tax=Affinibrenneria salicis TaxID=2590031 RepID=A0A5J5FUA1_9GAMM|nr:hypothetical protein [Affinibrenneria salicis]KAA8997028.1 hypothetical protein FJU30_20485 [Affinibrenneria salicis]